MIPVIAELIGKIEQHCPVGSESVSEDTSFPYSTYDYTFSNTQERGDMRLTLDIWDKSTSVLNIEQLAEDIRELLDDSILRLDNDTTRVYFDRQVSIPDPSDEIKRRRQTYLVYNYN